MQNIDSTFKVFVQGVQVNDELLTAKEAHKLSEYWTNYGYNAKDVVLEDYEMREVI